MRVTRGIRPDLWIAVLALGVLVGGLTLAPAQQWVTETRDPRQTQDEDFAKMYAVWTGEPMYGSPLVDHLPRVAGIPMPKDVLGYHVGAPQKLTYYADALRYYRALAAATPRVKIETIGKSDEGRDLVVVWVSSDENIKNLQANRNNLAKLADPRGRSDAEVRQLIQTTKPHYHLMGGLHSGETGPSEMLMEMIYRLATETSPYITAIRNNVYVSITPVADADGRDRNVDKFYCDLQLADEQGGRGGGPTPTCSLPYWGKYVYHDNNRDINLSQVQMRAITNWYYTAHPPILHDLHESLPLLYTYSGGPPQNPNLDPSLFAELSFFANWELSQMTKWGMPGVYTHAFMDGWSPGYLGSVSYNHNGMMKMYETQSGRDGGPGRAGAAGPAGAAGAGRGAAEAPGRGGQGAGRGPAAGQGRGGAPGAGPGAAGPGGGRGGGVPTGRGGGQDREWYRGIQVPAGMPANFTRRNNTNYMQTGVLSSLQLTAMFPNLVLENFYTRTRNSMNAGLNAPPHAYVIPVQRDMTKPAELVRVLRLQGIEIGVTTAEAKSGSDTFAAGSYIIKAGQPYWRLAKNLLEVQRFPDARLQTYDDSGWTMGYAFGVTVKEIGDKSILDVPATLIKDVTVKGQVIGAGGTAGMAVAHYGSNNMITFRYRLKQVPMKVAKEAFTVGSTSFPAGSFLITGSAADLAAARTAVESLGLTAAMFATAPSVPTHESEAPRVAIYSQWNGTQELGWYRHAFDQFGIPFDLIYKERVAAGNLERDYDVIIMATQNVNRGAIMAAPASRPSPYQKNERFKFLGMYGETADTTGGFGQAGVDAFKKFFEAGGTLIATHTAVRFPIDFGFARSVDTESVQGFTAQKPLVNAEILRPTHPVFYGYENRVIPVKFGQGQQVFRIGVADQENTLVQYVGGDDSVLSGLGDGAEALRGKAFAVDIPGAYDGKGRVIMFASNPVYRWQNHGEFNMVFNAIINWNDR